MAIARIYEAFKSLKGLEKFSNWTVQLLTGTLDKRTIVVLSACTMTLASIVKYGLLPTTGLILVALSVCLAIEGLLELCYGIDPGSIDNFLKMDRTLAPMDKYPEYSDKLNLNKERPSPFKLFKNLLWD